MLLEKNVVGKKTDWANFITLSDEHETPLLRMLPKGEEPVNVVKHYQLDAYAAPQSNPIPDGKDVDGFTSAGALRQEATARIQKFRQTAAVSELAEDVTDTAGIDDELAHQIPKSMTQMAREMDCAAGSAQTEHIDDGKTGHQFRGLGEWIRATPQTSGVPVTAPYLPAAAQIYTDVKANLNEDAIQAVLKQMWTTTGNKGRMLGFVGSALKKRFRDFQFYLPSSLTTQATARIITRAEGDTELGNTVDTYASDWGTVEMTLERWLMHENFGGSATQAQWAGYFLHRQNWSWHWKKMPTVYKQPYKGGSYSAFIEAIIMLLCKNPVGEGKVLPSDA
jgi:hypothetical protein